MRWVAVGALLFLCALAGYPLELGFSSHTCLSAATWLEEFRVEVGDAAWDVHAGAGLDDAGLVGISLGGEYQTESLALWVGVEFVAEGFSQLTGGLELSLTDFCGFGVEAVVDEAGFAGATISLWYEASAGDEGSSGATGLLEIDETGEVVGQTLCVGVSFPPWQMESTAWFGGGGLSSLELGVGLSWEEVAVGANFEWDPAGLRALGGDLSVGGESVTASGEASWLVDGSWLAAGDLTFGQWLDIRGGVSYADGLYTWEAEVGMSFEYAEFSFSTQVSEEGVGYAGGLSLWYEASSLEFRGSLCPEGELELELLVEVRISVDEGI